MYYYFKLNNSGVTTDFLISTLAQTDSSWIQYIAPPNFSVEAMTALLGKFQYDNITHVWSPYAPSSRILTKYEFNSRFTLEELVAIEEASANDPVVAVLKNKFNIADNIDLDDISVQDGLSILVSKTLITSNRKNIILG